ncbi:Oidioi.mRNA.OKI2018_I69.chr2.g6926.t1.cds [Oikopleura dioica]|uniref:Oidioi.mRNA.OKI2018_I69.chr2.g6926.t1.cds n=1 Tax=Oikopleura dioica TaxID=34765 RepID=A0ABN7TBB5_OIKDI|nr:Oidioi.mRNA.OKI2018_I69.chr2.g6926.t1.cds [Oikopleura dioica]
MQRDHSETEQLKSKVALQKMARPMPTDDFVSDMDRRKRVREILLHILSKLKVKDPTNFLHQKPCSLLYPNYPFNAHYDMTNVADKVNKMCFFNIHQFRQAVSKVCKCQTDFFPSNTIRHKFALKFDQFAYKITAYRNLLDYCEEIGIDEELPKRQLRDILVGNQIDTELPISPKDEQEDEYFSSQMSMAIEQNVGSPLAPGETRLNILQADAQPTVYNMDGRPMTLADITGRVHGAAEFTKKTRTIEDRAFLKSYMSYGPYSSFAPVFDSRNATLDKEMTDMMIGTRKDPFREDLEKIANADEFTITDYLAKSSLGNENAEKELLDELTYHEPKADQLETLKDLGIDISFLDAFKPGASERVENIQSLLDYIADVIPKLRKGSSTFSNDLADEAIAAITKVLKLTAPGAAVSVTALRKAMTTAS